MRELIKYFVVSFHVENIYKIIKLSKPQHKYIFIASVIITIQAVLQQITPITLKYVVDELSLQIDKGTGNYNRLVMLFGLILFVNLLGIFISSISQRLGDFISSRLGKYLTEVYYRKIFTLPQSYYDSEISGKIVNQLNRGILSIREFVGSAINFMGPALLQAIFGIAVLAYYNITIALLAFAVFPVYIALSSYSTKKWGEMQMKKNVHEDAARGRIQEVISNIKLVKTYNTKEHEWQYVSKEYGILNKLYDIQSNQYHILNFIREFGLELAFVVILFIVFQSTFRRILSLGEMILIIQVLNQLRWPLFGMSFILEQVQQAEADSKAFFEVLTLHESEQPKDEVATHNIILEPEITFENVSFSYNNNHSVLKNINLKLANRETIALVGHSGAGKTTLVNLILKLYEPTGGDIRLSQQHYSKTSHSFIRNHIALVFQESELFSSTIKENVAYGMQSATDEQIITALKLAQAYEFVSQMKDGIHAKIGERGIKLSGGQKQRIQIARAILHDKPILILDEATSSLDAKSELLVQKALERLFERRLVIIIAHRFSTIQNVDSIVVIDKGTIADQGSPSTLAKRPGLYTELLQYQIEGNKKLLSKYELF